MNRLLTPSPPNLPVSMRTRSRTRRRAANPGTFSRSYVHNLELVLRLRTDQGPITVPEWTPPRKALGPKGAPLVWILRRLNGQILTAGGGIAGLYEAGCVGWITPWSQPPFQYRLSYLPQDWTWQLDPQRWATWGLSHVEHLIIVPEYLGFWISRTMHRDGRSKHSSVRYVIEMALLSFVFGAPPWVRRITIRAEAAADNEARVGYSELERARQYLNRQLPAGPAGQYRRWYAPLRRLRKGRNLAHYDVNFEY